VGWGVFSSQERISSEATELRAGETSRGTARGEGDGTLLSRKAEYCVNSAGELVIERADA
jgi:hypothetical protein